MNSALWVHALLVSQWHPKIGKLRMRVAED